MKEQWQKIELWLGANVAGVLETLLPGATLPEIQRAEEILGVTLPDEMREAYAIHKGQALDQATAGYGLVAGHELLRLSHITAAWRGYKQQYDEGTFDVMPEPAEGVKDDFWNPRWIPITTMGAGEHYCIDLDPGPGGSVAQIILWTRDGHRSVVARSFHDWFAQFARDLEEGNYTVARPSMTNEAD